MANETKPPIKAHSKSEYKRLSSLGANVLPPEPTNQPTEPSAREWLIGKDLEMLLGSHIGASGNYLCELLDEYASYKLKSIAAEVGEEAAEEIERVPDIPHGFKLTVGEGESCTSKTRHEIIAAIIASTIERKQ